MRKVLNRPWNRCPHLVHAIEPCGVGAVDPVHTAGEVRLRRLNDEVKVIGHQHPGRDRPAEPLRRHAEEVEKCLAIPIGSEDRPAFIAAWRQMIESAFEFKS